MPYPLSPPTPAPDGGSSLYAIPHPPIHQLPTPPHTGLHTGDDGLLASRANSPGLADMAVSNISCLQDLPDFAAAPRRGLLLQQPTPMSLPDLDVDPGLDVEPDVVEADDADAEIGEVIGARPPSQETVWISSPAPSSSSSDSSSSDDGRPASILDIFRRPPVAVHSPEILLAYFDKKTCGILSVKDGPTENPWRTLIWPLARDSQALYHAVSSMTAFHMCRERPELQIEGMEHMRKSLRFLGQGLSHGNIREDAALGTTLVLAFSEAFDRHISTGIQHLRGARVLLAQALARVRARQHDPVAFKRLQFLYNVWVYLDVLARLTSDTTSGGGGESDGATADDNLAWCGRLVASDEIDPLLGCAATLFPLIAQAAGLVQRVRRLDQQQHRDSAAAEAKIVADARRLARELESWALEDKSYVPIEDPTNEVVHCRNTAEAYRWATLLYLRQALPGLLLPAAPSAHKLARRVMDLIASIPASSRSCIVHIYPLLVAGCEAVGAGERAWVGERWEAMISRLRIGNVEKAWQVVKEVWLRRDAFLASATATATAASTATATATALYDSRRAYIEAGDGSDNGQFFWDWPPPPAPPPFCDDARVDERLHSKHRKRGDYEYEVSIKGRLHWLGVMKEWKWEGVWSFFPAILQL